MLFDCCQRVGFFTERQLMDQAGEESEKERYAAGVVAIVPSLFNATGVVWVLGFDSKAATTEVRQN